MEGRRVSSSPRFIEAGFVWRKLELCVAGAPPNFTSLAGHGMQPVNCPRRSTSSPQTSSSCEVLHRLAAEQ